MRLATTHPEWVLGFEDEVWWSRLAQPALHAWGETPLHMVEQAVAKTDPDPKALACYGLLVSCPGDLLSLPEQLWLRFVEGRPVSALTTPCLAWGCEQLAARGKTAWLLVWDNASWHVSQAVRDWIQAHHRHIKQQMTGVRIINCYLPIKSPWLNPIEPRWLHTKRRVLEPERLLSAAELEARVYARFGCDPHPRLSIPEKVA